MRKGFFLFLATCLMALMSQAQLVFMEQDFRITPDDVVPYTQVQWDFQISEHFSLSPCMNLVPGWTQALLYVNYAAGPLVLGVGPGVEYVDDWSPRVSPWMNLKAPIDSTRDVQFFSLWEIGKGKDNIYWYNALTYEAPKVSAGAIYRRYWGVGPMVGYKIPINGLLVKISAAPLYDFGEERFKMALTLNMFN